MSKNISNRNSGILYLKKVEQHLDDYNKEIIENILMTFLQVNDYNNIQESLNNVYKDGSKILKLIIEGIDEKYALKKGIKEDIIKWINKLSLIYSIPLTKLWQKYDTPFDWDYLSLGKIQYGNAIELRVDIVRYDKEIISIQGEPETIYALMRTIASQLENIDLEIDEEIEVAIDEIIHKLHKIKKNNSSIKKPKNEEVVAGDNPVEM